MRERAKQLVGLLKSFYASVRQWVDANGVTGKEPRALAPGCTSTALDCASIALDYNCIGLHKH